MSPKYIERTIQLHNPFTVDMIVEEDVIIPPRRPECKYVTAPLEYIMEEEEGYKDHFFSGFRNVNLAHRRINRCVREAREKFGLRVRLANCLRKEAIKVGTYEQLTWKLEISYDVSHQHRKPTDVVTYEDFMRVATLFLPTHKTCHTPS